MAIIKESYRVLVSQSDLLSSPSRLESIPETGTLTLEVSATECNSADYATLEISTPDGQTPIRTAEGVIPYSGYSTTDMLCHNKTEWVFVLEVSAGGHVGVNVTLNGTALAMVIATLEF